MKPLRRTIIGKHALVLAAKGENELASQIFVYDHLREIRVDIRELEVKVLMNYDESYYRVFKIKLNNENDENERKKAEETVLKFYNDLLNVTMKLTNEELENIRKQQNKMMEKNNKKN